jgi:hypothetical protein
MLKRSESMDRELEEEQLYLQYQEQIIEDEAKEQMDKRRQALTRLRDRKGNIIKPKPEIVKRSLDEMACLERGPNISSNNNNIEVTPVTRLH